MAAELELLALGARRRGALDVALAALQRSAQLSKGPALKGRRLLGAADMAFELGEVDLGGRLLRTAGALELEARDRVRLEWIRELSDERLIGGAERVEGLIELAPAGMTIWRCSFSAGLPCDVGRSIWDRDRRSG